MTKRIVEFDYLRGIAIIYIVLGHSISNSGQGFPLWLENLLRGGTGVFVFVSGFFFHRIFYPRFAYKDFMLKKLQNVFVPFLVVSMVGLLLQSGELTFIHHKTWDVVIAADWKTLQTGFVLFPHWYIPFIMLTFAVSPVHKWYIEARPAIQWALFAASFIASALIHRGEENINVIHSVFYFTPFYLLGILYSQYQDSFYRHNKAIQWLCWVVMILAVYMQTYVDAHVGNYHKPAFEWRGVDWQMVQKMAACILLLELSRWMVGKPGADHLHFLARISFAIFFLHPIFAVIIGTTIWYAGTHYGVHLPQTLGWSLGFSLLMYLYLMYCTVALVLLLKRCLGERSRWVMGW